MFLGLQRDEIELVSPLAAAHASQDQVQTHFKRLHRGEVDLVLQLVVVHVDHRIHSLNVQTAADDAPKPRYMVENGIKTDSVNIGVCFRNYWNYKYCF